VVVCPTGIDIRDGLQMECINCTQCIDACDDVMDRVGRPRGLIRYSSQDAIAGKAKRLWRPRTVLYPLILLALLGSLGFAVATKSAFDARVIRGKGAPFTIVDSQWVTNPFRIRLVNRTETPQVYRMEVVSPAGVRVELPDPEALRLAPGANVLVPFRLRFPSQLTMGEGSHPVEVQVHDDSGNARTLSFRVLGPRR